MKVSDILRVKGNTLYTVGPDEPVAQAIETYLGRSIPTESEECAQDQNTAPTGEAADAENLLSGATPTSGRKEARP